MPLHWTSSKRYPRRNTALTAAMACCSLSTTALNIALLSGSTRTQGPPNPILAPRVVRFLQEGLETRGHVVTHVDPRSLPPQLEKPHFAYAASQVPPTLSEVHAILQKADAYLCVTPEYNHAPAPGLLNVLNHFGSSTFSFKPSAIVSYSAGQWGGTRAALALRPILSELGCLPVSAMIHIPEAQNVLDDEGSLLESSSWEVYCARCFSQLEWWATAAKSHRDEVDPFLQSPPFRRKPKDRNAP